MRRNSLGVEPVQIHAVTFGPQPVHPEADFLIEGFLPKGYLVLLASEPNVGKTCLATAIALAVASGTPFAGMSANPCHVLWFALEESHEERAQALSFASAEVRARLTESLEAIRAQTEAEEAEARAKSDSKPQNSKLQTQNSKPAKDHGAHPLPSTLEKDPKHPATPSLTRRFNPAAQSPEPMQPDKSDQSDPSDLSDKAANAPTLLFQSYGMDPIDDPIALSSFEQTLVHNKIGLVVIDPLHCATTGHSLYDGWTARRTLSGIKRICARNGITALILHHVKERGSGIPRPAESPQLSAASSIFWVLRSAGGPPPPPAPEEEGGRGVEVNEPSSRRITLLSRGRGSFANRTWLFESSHPLDYRIAQPAELEFLGKPAPRPPNPVDEAVFQALLDKPKTTADIIDRVDMTPNTVRNAITRMYGRGDLEVSSIESGARKYRINRHSEWWKNRQTQIVNHQNEEKTDEK